MHKLQMTSYDANIAIIMSPQTVLDDIDSNELVCWVCY